MWGRGHIGTVDYDYNLYIYTALIATVCRAGVCNFHLVTCSAFSGKHTVSKLTLSYYVRTLQLSRTERDVNVHRLKYTYRTTILASPAVYYMYSVECLCSVTTCITKYQISGRAAFGVLVRKKISEDAYSTYILTYEIIYSHYTTRADRRLFRLFVYNYVTETHFRGTGSSKF